MLSSSQSEKELNGIEATPNTVLVREQLRRLLSHPLFMNSKRYPVLLAYVVEQTLLGNANELKERTIGVEAFGRQPDYDVNLDPVVRMTAAEVRKRLSQYYYNSEHAGELVIELPVGSYIPIIREPASTTVPNPVPIAEQNPEPENSSGTEARDTETRSKPPVRIEIAVLAAVVLATLIGFGLGRIKIPIPPSNIERFWEPMSSSSSRITYCLGETANPDNPDHLPVPNSGLNLSDVISLARSIAPLVSHNASFRVVAASETEFAQLREGPVVLIGAFNNPWTMRITQELPFGFEYDANHVRRIVDRKSSDKKSWTLEWQVPNVKLSRDYALVARIHDNVTGEPVIILAGILQNGTEAAGEVVSNPAYLDAVLQKVPKNWDKMNLEAVIETQVIEGHPGPPTVVAVKTW
ncbi:MAG TPA: hypothetical protein VMU28_10205 [Terriglobales bacterium]|nr:hypothetical protein [Terriglobales bacterium]